MSESNPEQFNETDHELAESIREIINIPTGKSMRSDAEVAKGAGISTSEVTGVKILEMVLKAMEGQDGTFANKIRSIVGDTDPKDMDEKSTPHVITMVREAVQESQRQRDEEALRELQAKMERR